MNESLNITLQKSRRESGIELLKVFGILMIILCHVVQTLCSENSAVPYFDYVIQINMAITNIKLLFIQLLSYSGQFGNWVFLLVLHGF